ncbi:hypothetical protein J2Y58_004020 [Sphingomonas sp. BE138]|uniref:hypothetical protein n=1 Tax=Sphingomonas sp. BE138 TaxID=2817845 RepID=UPI00285D8448|nr:hypothetical protein [Sphingomonas sp. BE138]MDR6790637.1 hypothetical protein [Sphingomonas sp. BE138]
MFHDIRVTIEEFAEVNTPSELIRLSVLGAAMSIAADSNQKWDVGSASLLSFLGDLYDADCLTVYADLFGRPTAYVADVECGSPSRTELGILRLERTPGSIRYVADVCCCEADPSAVIHAWTTDRLPKLVKFKAAKSDSMYHVVQGELATRTVERDLIRRYGNLPQRHDPIHIFDLRHLASGTRELGDILETLHRWRPEGWPCLVLMMQLIMSITDAGHLKIYRDDGSASLIVWGLTTTADLELDGGRVRDPLVIDLERAHHGDTLAFYLVAGDPKTSVAAMSDIASRCRKTKVLMREEDAAFVIGAISPVPVSQSMSPPRGWVRPDFCETKA